ncbi:MAG: DNA-binding protein [Candidatus Aenigmatarchaeota archaeon]
MKQKIILDTNMLMVPAQFRVDIFEHMKRFSPEFFTFSSCMDELEKIAVLHSRSAGNARIALELARKNDVKVLETKESADKAILNYAKLHNVIVATNDRKLIKSLKACEIKIIRLRQKKYIAIE